MPPVKSASISALEENEASVFLESSAVLLRVASNILKEPTNPKYRSISLGSNVVTSKLLPAAGAIECLFEMGFQEGSDKLVLPGGTSLDAVKRIHEQLLLSRDTHLKFIKPAETQSTPKVVLQPSCSKAPKLSISQSCMVGFAPVLKDLSNLINSTQNGFMKRIIYQSKDVLKYENSSLQLKALKHVPLVELQIKVENNLRKLQLAIKKKELHDQVVDYQELLLIELTSWFKNEFFKWVDTPDCSKCGNKTVACKNVPVPGTDRVELYRCPVCNTEEKFFRYNDPEKLLETRKGRCGEWANCFVLICRSLGWDVRLVIDLTDHVWAEVYSDIQKRWLHCDPCENIVDAPLLYETGWNKKLTYVIAYSKDDIQDVTWRYSCNHKEVLKRRTACREEELLELLLNVRKCLLTNGSQTRHNYVLKRCALELVDLMKEKHPTVAENEGRTSGSLAWRLSRGEIDTVVTKKIEPFVWKIGGKEDKFVLRYSAAKNEYVTGEREKVVKGWENGVFEMTSIFRKEETDWKMVYLARNERSDVGLISWKFEIENESTIDKVEVKLESAMYESGKIFGKICAGETCLRLPSGTGFFSTDTVGGSKSMTISVQLSGGNGNCAWQHSQLLRQPSNSDEYNFVVIIHLRR